MVKMFSTAFTVSTHGIGISHALEGSDDMPSHIRMALTRTSESIPIMDASLQLGTWQGLFVYEHRRRPTQRSIAVSVVGDAG